MGAMDEGIVQHLAVAAEEVERQIEPMGHFAEGDDRFLVLVAIGEEQHGLHGFFIIEVGARQVEVLGLESK